MNTNRILMGCLMAAATETLTGGGATVVCPITGLAPLAHPSLPTGTPGAAFYGKTGEVCHYTANGAKKGNPGTGRGPRSSLIPLSLVATPVTNWTATRGNESEAARNKRLVDNFSFAIGNFGRHIEAIIPGKDGEKKSRTDVELDAYAKKKGVKLTTFGEMAAFAAENRHYQVGGTQGKKGTLAELSKAYPEKAASVAMASIHELKESIGSQIVDGFRLSGVAGDNGEKETAE